jgi:hypothetical protein
MNPIQAGLGPVPSPFRRFKKYVRSLDRSAAGYLLLEALAYTVCNYETVFNQGVTMICSLPLVCGNHHRQEFHPREPRFQDLVLIQRGFEPLLDITGYGIMLAADVKKSQGALQDLSTLVCINLVTRRLLCILTVPT